MLHPGIPTSRLPTHGSLLPAEGSRHYDTNVNLNSPMSKYPRKHSGKTKSKAGKTNQPEQSLGPQESLREAQAASPRLPDQVDQSRSMPGRRSRSSSSSSTSSAISLRLRTSDLVGPDQREDAIWLSSAPTKSMQGRFIYSSMGKLHVEYHIYVFSCA